MSVWQTRIGPRHSFHGWRPPEQTRPKVISAARKALELDPQLAEAHILLADMEQAQWQWAEAEAEYRRALELSPNDAGAHIEFADWLLCQGRTEEAVAWARVPASLTRSQSRRSHRVDSVLRPPV